MSWNRRAWSMAWPLILSNLSVPLLGVVDTAVMGHLPDPAYLGAVAVGALVFDFVYWGFGFLRMGTTGFTAQARGAGDPDEVRLSLIRPLLMGLGIGVGLLAVQGLVAGLAFTLVDAGGDVERLARDYFAVRIWAAPAVLANYAILGWLLGMQQPKTALALQVVTNGLNVVLDLWFVMGLGWGVEGVALASAIAQWVTVLVGLSFVGLPRMPWARILDRGAFGALWRVNRDIFIRTLCLLGGFAWFTTQGARQGEVVLAANAVLLNLQTMMAFALDGFAHATEALVGDRLGADDRPGLRSAIGATMRMSAAIAAVFALAWWIGGAWVVDRLTDLPDVRTTAYAYLPWAIASPLVSVWCFQFDGICIGATRTAAMRNAMILSLVGFLVIGYPALGAFGNHGLWAAFLGFMVLRAATLAPAIRSLVRVS